MKKREIKIGAVVYYRVTGQQYIIKSISYENRFGFVVQVKVSQISHLDPDLVDIGFKNGEWNTLANLCTNFYMSHDDYELHKRYVDGRREYLLTHNPGLIEKIWRWWKGIR